MEKNNKNHNGFEQFAGKITRVAGHTITFIIACSVVVIWLITGPIFNYSDTWQLIINTGTTIITFLMVFLIQKTQNKDSIAIQIKLNELVASNENASNRLVSVEDMTEEEMIVLSKYYSRLAKMAKKDISLQTSHSIEEAHDNQQGKSLKQSPNKKRNYHRHRRSPRRPPDNKNEIKANEK
jgi:low affinity Fe/Cu permease